MNPVISCDIVHGLEKKDLQPATLDAKQILHHLLLFIMFISLFANIFFSVGSGILPTVTGLYGHPFETTFKSSPGGYDHCTTITNFSTSVWDFFGGDVRFEVWQFNWNSWVFFLGCGIFSTFLIHD